MVQKGKARKTGEFIAVGIVSAVAGTLGTLAVTGNTLAHSPEQPKPTQIETAPPTPEGFMALNEQQRAEVDKTTRRMALNDYLEVRKAVGKDSYNGYGQLMAKTKKGGDEHMSWVRFENTPDSVVIGVESYMVSEGASFSKLTSFTAIGEVVDSAVADGKLTTEEVKRMFDGDGLKFKEGEVTYPLSGDTVHVAATEGGVVARSGVEDDDFVFVPDASIPPYEALKQYMNS